MIAYGPANATAIPIISFFLH